MTEFVQQVAPLQPSMTSRKRVRFNAVSSSGQPKMQTHEAIAKLSSEEKAWREQLWYTVSSFHLVFYLKASPALARVQHQNGHFRASRAQMVLCLAFLAAFCCCFSGVFDMSNKVFASNQLYYPPEGAVHAAIIGEPPVTCPKPVSGSLWHMTDTCFALFLFSTACRI